MSQSPVGKRPAREADLTTRLPLVPGLRMSYAIPPRPIRLRGMYTDAFNFSFIIMHVIELPSKEISCAAHEAFNACEVKVLCLIKLHVRNDFTRWKYKRLVAFHDRFTPCGKPSGTH